MINLMTAVSVAHGTCLTTRQEKKKKDQTDVLSTPDLIKGAVGNV